jgi:hypothetical protein
MDRALDEPTTGLNVEDRKTADGIVAHGAPTNVVEGASGDMGPFLKKLL